MRLTLWVASLFLIIILGGTFLFIKFSPPLEIGTVASSDDKQIALVGIGNKGFSMINITEVLVNTNKAPIDVKLQESNIIHGFTLTDNYNSHEDKDVTFKNIEDVDIKRGTSPATNFENPDEGTASEKNTIYGVHVINDRAITDIQITYKYLGISFTKPIKI